MLIPHLTAASAATLHYTLLVTSIVLRNLWVYLAACSLRFDLAALGGSLSSACATLKPFHHHAAAAS